MYKDHVMTPEDLYDFNLIEATYKGKITDAGILAILCRVADLSPDPSSQNAAAIFPAPGDVPRPAWAPDMFMYPLSVAINTFPVGVDVAPASRWERPEKYYRVVHAETGAITHAARDGRKIRGQTMFACWAACGPCAAQIIEAGIKRLVTLESSRPGTDGSWDASITIGVEMLAEAGVVVEYIPHPVTPEPFTLLRGEQPMRV
jgi:hypothetical protein